MAGANAKRAEAEVAALKAVLQKEQRASASVRSQRQAAQDALASAEVQLELFRREGEEVRAAARREWAKQGGGKGAVGRGEGDSACA